MKLLTEADEKWIYSGDWLLLGYYDRLYFYTMRNPDNYDYYRTLQEIKFLIA